MTGEWIWSREGDCAEAEVNPGAAHREVRWKGLTCRMILLLTLLKAEGFRRRNDCLKRNKNKIHDPHCFQRKLPEQDIAQGSYIALPLTLLLLLAGYNHDKVGHGVFIIQVLLSYQWILWNAWSKGLLRWLFWQRCSQQSPYVTHFKKPQCGQVFGQLHSFKKT